MKNRRLLIAAAIVAGVAAMAFWPRTMPVDIVPVTRGPLEVTLDEEGATRVHDRFVVSAPVAGHLDRIDLEPGDPVVRGRTVVARIAPAAPPLLDPREQAERAAAVEAARASMGQARTERDRALAALTRARSVARRQDALLEHGAASRDDAEAAHTALRTAEETTRVAEFALGRVEQELRLAEARVTPSSMARSGQRVDVTAPVDGVVLRRFHESEATVPAGDALIEIGDPRHVEIVADFLSSDAVQIPAGATVSIERWGGPMPLHGRVRRVEPSGFMKVSALGVEEQRVNVIVDLDDPSAVPRLGDGYRVDVRVVVWRADDVLQAPVGALFRRGDAWAAFVVRDGRARLQPVSIGRRNDRAAQVLEGLADGTPLVLHPPDTLTDGARVRPRATGADR